MKSSIISTIFLLLLWALPIVIKAVKKEKTVSKPERPNPSIEQQEYEEQEMIPNVQQMQSNVPNEQEYFTYESLTEEDVMSSKTIEKEEDNPMQVSENEEEKTYELTFEEEEVCKGFIYSEILKKKYN